MTAEMYDTLKDYVGSNNGFTDDLINFGYSMGYRKAKMDIINFISMNIKNKSYCKKDLCDESQSCDDCEIRFLEKLKEQNNETEA